MDARSWRTITGWSGLAFVVVFLASELALADTPALDRPSGEVRRWFEVNSNQIAWTTLGVALSVGLLFLLFASGLHGLLAPADEPNAGVWSRLSFASAIVMVAVSGSKAGFWAVLIQEPVVSAVSDATLKAVASIEAIMIGTVLPWVLAVFLLGFSVVVLETSVMPRWLGWLGSAAALSFVAGSFWLVAGQQVGIFGALNLLGYLGFLVWVSAAAVTMLGTDRTAPGGSRAS